MGEQTPGQFSIVKSDEPKVPVNVADEFARRRAATLLDGNFPTTTEAHATGTAVAIKDKAARDGEVIDSPKVRRRKAILQEAQALMGQYDPSLYITKPDIPRSKWNEMSREDPFFKPTRVDLLTLPEVVREIRQLRKLLDDLYKLYLEFGHNQLWVDEVRESYKDLDTARQPITDARDEVSRAMGLLKYKLRHLDNYSIYLQDPILWPSESDTVDPKNMRNLDEVQMQYPRLSDEERKKMYEGMADGTWAKDEADNKG